MTAPEDWPFSREARRLKGEVEPEERRPRPPAKPHPDGLYFRAGTQEDRPFVIDTWAESYKYAHAAGLIPMPHYQRVYREALNWILDRPHTDVLLALGPEDVFCGWIGVDRNPQITRRVKRLQNGRYEWCDAVQPAGVPLVLFVFVKDPYRGMGVGRALFDAAGVELGGRFLYASKLQDTTALVAKVCPLAQWAPIAARFSTK